MYFLKKLVSYASWFDRIRRRVFVILHNIKALAIFNMFEFHSLLGFVNYYKLWIKNLLFNSFYWSVVIKSCKLKDKIFKPYG